MKTSQAEHSEKTLAGEIADTLKHYVRTQFLLFILMTAVFWTVLSLLRVQYAPLLAVLTGALSEVPVFGITVAAAIAAGFAIFDGSRFLNGLPPVFEGVVVLLIYFLLNLLRDYILTPYLIGKSVSVHPLVILLSVIIGTWLFGIAGAVLAVPALLVARTVIRHFEAG